MGDVFTRFCQRNWKTATRKWMKTQRINQPRGNRKRCGDVMTSGSSCQTIKLLAHVRIWLPTSLIPEITWSLMVSMVTECKTAGVKDNNAISLWQCFTQVGHVTFFSLVFRGFGTWRCFDLPAEQRHPHIASSVSFFLFLVWITWPHCVSIFHHLTVWWNPLNTSMEGKNGTCTFKALQ